MPCPAAGRREGFGADLALDNGVVVDQALRSSDPRIFAAGDVANACHPLFGTHVRVEHWANALHFGPAAARRFTWTRWFRTMVLTSTSRTLIEHAPCPVMVIPTDRDAP